MEDELIAHDHVSKAHELEKGGCCMNMFKSVSTRNSEARDHYRQAANLFKKSQKHAEAAECFSRCGEINQQLKDTISNDYEESAYCYGLENNNNKQMEILNKLVIIYENNSNFTGAGKVMQQVGEIYQTKLLNYIEAIESYKKSADYYQMDSNAKVREKEMRLKAADLMCQEDHQDSYNCLKIYESIGLEHIKNPLMKSNGKVLLLKAVYLELFYKDVTNAHALLNRYVSEEGSIENMGEYDFLLSAFESMKEENLQGFKLAVTKLNTSEPLDKWRIVLLNKIQNKITGTYPNNPEARQDVYVDNNGEFDLK